LRKNGTNRKKGREFSGRGMASIFGAPISWVALLGVMGALSIVPMIFYPFGGGLLGWHGRFWPHAGLVLGPWAGPWQVWSAADRHVFRRDPISRID
jgi:hypothetical protein